MTRWASVHNAGEPSSMACCACGTRTKRVACWQLLARRRKRRRSAGDEREAGLDHRARAAQLGRLHGIAAESGAVRLEGAVVTERTRMGSEVVALAGPQDGRPQRVGATSDARDRLSG